MDLTIENLAEGLCHLSLAGRISQVGSGNQADVLSQMLGEANYNQNILLSLQRTEHIDSSGIGWLLAADKKIRQAGGNLVIHSVPIDVQHVLSVMNLGKVLRIAKDREQATSMVQGEVQ